MARPWSTIETFETRDGSLELRQRGDDDFLIAVDGRILMNSRAHRSEVALAELGCAPISARPQPRVLIGGLGMGYSLRAALDVLPESAAITVAELHPKMAEWCRGPLAPLTGGAVLDPRVEVVHEDVSRIIASAASKGGARQFDAILLDLFEGPRDPQQGVRRRDPFYGPVALKRTRAALKAGGVFAIWSEFPSRHFEKDLAGAGFSYEKARPGRGGLRHVVYLARPHIGARRRGRPERASGGPRRSPAKRGTR